jgi:hypothetical protein
MMNLVFFWFPVVLAHSTPAPGPPAPKATPERVIPAEQAWADGLSKRSDLGWELRDLDSSHAGETIEISVTMASQAHAERFRISYQMDSESFSDFSREAVTLPTEARQYEAASLLFEELSTGAPVAVSYDCADFYLDFGSSGVSLDQDDFSVPLWSTGHKPGRALSRWLSSSLSEGQLIDIRDERIDNGADVVSQVIFVVDSAEGIEEMTVELGSKGQPVHLQVQHSPGGWHWDEHPSSEALQTLASAGAIRRLNFEVDGFVSAPKLQIVAKGQAEMRLDLGAFSSEEHECDC